MNMMRKTTEEIADYIQQERTIIIPLGSVEQHSSALPLGTDSIIAEFLAEKTAERTGMLVAPLLAPGISLVPHMEFEGTISVMPQTMTNMIKETILCLYKHGFRNFLFVNGHGGNDGAIKNACTELCYTCDNIKIAGQNWWRITEVEEFAKQSLGRPIGHACVAEASLLLHIDPVLVKQDKLSQEFHETAFMVSNNMARKYITRSGIINADQRGATAQLGQKLTDIAVDFYVKKIEEIKSE